MRRRDFFFRICAAGAAAAAPELFAARDLKARFYFRAELVEDQGRPVRASNLVAGRNYIFHYPFESTPCFLLNLGRPTVRDVALKTDDGAAYRWPGGVGAKRSVVAFSAICAHRMSYPTPQISFISYRDQSTAGRAARPNTIHCCSEHSEYDPADGARVLGGPAQQPLAAILLEHEPATDALHAVGTLGGEMFQAFFEQFEFRLTLDYGASSVRRRVSGHTVVQPLEQFCRQQVRC
jgi:arsenite oxidase small subunit